MYRNVSLYIFYLIFMILSLTIAFTYSAIILLARNKKRSIKSISILTFILEALSTYLFIPVFGTFLYSFNCNNGALYNYPEINCWSGIHIALFCFSLIGVIAILLLQLIITVTFVETTNAKTKVSSRKNSKIFYLEQILKVILTCLMVFNKDDDIVYFIIQITILVGYGYIMYKSKTKELLFYNHISSTVIIFL